ncbi:MAG: hypothetical protein ACOZAO_02980 [Patescibacteria group bacterium]
MEAHKLIQTIIEEQSQIIGKRLAHARALSSGAVQFPKENSNEVNVTKEPKIALENLLTSYEEIFGQASVDVCLSVLRKFPYEEIEPYLPDTVKPQIQPLKK